MSDKLKPCPFCGGRAEIFEIDVDSGEFLFAKCQTCGATGKKVWASMQEERGRREATEAWNRRSS